MNGFEEGRVMAETPGRLHSIETFGALDGPGIRYVLFLQGCPLRCLFCHNPDTWSLDETDMILPSRAFADILRYRNFISSGGVTISGGEPLLQPDFCRELIDLCHTEGIHCAIDTAGSIPLKECRHAIDAADLLLLDIKALDPALCKKITGRDNRAALEILSYCEITGKDVWVRHVLVPGLTLERPLLERLADFLTAYSCVKRVELLPFHKMGEYKWESMQMRSPLFDTSPPGQNEVEAAKDIFKGRGIPV